jgi:aryl-alcohol dehydrogenase-like predicted oxidoreductase
MMIEQFPQIEVILFPYTAKSQALPEESLFDAVKKMDVGVFGIKPFASNSLFKGTSAPNDPNAEEDNRLARLAIRYVLSNPAITSPIPGLISPRQVDNVAQAIVERRKHDREGLEETGKADLDRATEGLWARLDPHHRWLRDWEFV